MVLFRKKKVTLVHVVFYSSDFAVVVTCFWLMILIHCGLYDGHDFHHLLLMHISSVYIVSLED